MEKTEHIQDVVNITDLFSIKIQEAKINEDSRTVEAVILKHGWSMNGRYYSPSIAEGLAKFINENSENASRRMFNNHAILPGDRQKRRVTDVLANVTEAKVENGTCVATIQVYETPEDAEALWERIKKNPKDVGLSIDAIVKVSEGEADGRKGQIIEEWKALNSIDFVLAPSAGGGIKEAKVEEKMAAEVKEEYNKDELEIQEAKWTTKYINDLPDSCFAYIEPGGKKDGEGKTEPRSLRHFPYKNALGMVDMPHLRNALARAPQSPFGELAMPKLTRAAKVGKVGIKNKESVGVQLVEEELLKAMQMKHVRHECNEIMNAIWDKLYDYNRNEPDMEPEKMKAMVASMFEEASMMAKNIEIKPTEMPEETDNPKESEATEMTLDELKKSHPELVEQLRVEEQEKIKSGTALQEAKMELEQIKTKQTSTEVALTEAQKVIEDYKAKEAKAEFKVKVDELIEKSEVSKEAITESLKTDLYESENIEKAEKRLNDIKEIISVVTSKTIKPVVEKKLGPSDVKVDSKDETKTEDLKSEIQRHFKVKK